MRAPRRRTACAGCRCSLQRCGRQRGRGGCRRSQAGRARGPPAVRRASCVPSAPQTAAARSAPARGACREWTSVSMQCTCSAHAHAHAVHMQCTCSAHAVHTVCTCSAHAVHTVCSSISTCRTMSVRPQLTTCCSRPGCAMASLPATLCVDVLHWLPLLLRPASPCRLSEPERFDSSFLTGETCMALRVLPSAAESTLCEPPGPGGGRGRSPGQPAVLA